MLRLAVLLFARHLDIPSRLICSPPHSFWSIVQQRSLFDRAISRLEEEEPSEYDEEDLDSCEDEVVFPSYFVNTELLLKVELLTDSSESDRVDVLVERKRNWSISLEIYASDELGLALTALNRDIDG